MFVFSKLIFSDQQRRKGWVGAFFKKKKKYRRLKIILTLKNLTYHSAKGNILTRTWTSFRLYTENQLTL